MVYLIYRYQYVYANIYTSFDLNFFGLCSSVLLHLPLVIFLRIYLFIYLSIYFFIYLSSRVIS